jgi:hypothetical protein
MAIKIRTETSGEYTHYYAKTSLAKERGDEIYVAISGPHIRYDIHGKNGVSLIEKTVSFGTPFYSEEKFLPPVVVGNHNIDDLIQRAAEWHLNEYTLYLTGLEAEMELEDNS